jgi:glycoside/pentoside/hexuronide:cation symporter, GPH family
MEHSHHHKTAPQDRIPVFQKAVYSIGALVNQMQAAAISAMVLVLNLGLGMNPVLVGLVGTIPRLLDAFTDPLVGYVSDNSRNRYGRRRPFMFFGALISGLLFALLFQLHKEHSEMYNFWYFLVIQCLFVVSFAFFAIPWIALGFEMTPDYHERTRLQGTGNTIAQIAWLISPWLFTFMYTTKDVVQGARLLAIIFGVFIAVGGILPAIFNKEFFVNPPKPPKRSVKDVMLHFISGCSITLKNRPFVKLCLMTFLVFNGFMLASAFTSYVIFFYDFGGDYAKGGALLGWFGTVTALSNFLFVIPLITWIATKIGKRNTFLITIPISIVGYALKWIGYNPQHPYLLLIAAPFIAFGLGSVFTIVSSMLADVCDLDELQTGSRREGTFGAIYWWMIKLGQAAASLISGVLLNATGFNVALAGHQTAHALLYMRLCDIGIPIVASLLAICIILTFEVTEDKAYDIRKQLEERRGKA